MLSTSPKARRIRDQLDQRRRELLVRYHDELDHAEAEISETSPELVDVANDQRDVQLLSLMSEVDARHLEQIVAALRRLDQGAYGICVECKDRILAARLEAMPEAATCTECAMAAEGSRRVSRVS